MCGSRSHTVDMATSTVPEQPAPLYTSPHRKHTREEMLEIFRAFREEVRAANPENRDLLQELLDERRAEADGE